ncbi:4-carboxymuconolactone decarboxylase [Blastococcus sp. Marseille-P5729]|uniref:4-carboxymuconolactone decarboxylase n=1 Tax=Blastococcus sp. Marseille-P5729 TaxID=2086582 RepID=UPI000D100560|nr:4-carboxymuconolactone decarboxylase [Blastococcus sp. Marseille-P5729]
MDDEMRRKQGMQVRREVLGDEHVDRANDGITQETARFQDFITRVAWGDVWNSDVIDRRSRSMVTLAVLMALGRDDELAIHIRAAQRNGLSRAEIAEVFLQASIYAGVPAANTALKLLKADPDA